MNELGFQVNELGARTLDDPPADLERDVDTFIGELIGRNLVLERSLN